MSTDGERYRKLIQRSADHRVATVEALIPDPGQRRNFLRAYKARMEDEIQAEQALRVLVNLGIRRERSRRWLAAARPVEWSMNGEAFVDMVEELILDPSGSAHQRAIEDCVSRGIDVDAALAQLAAERAKERSRSFYPGAVGDPSPYPDDNRPTAAAFTDAKAST